MKAAVIGAGVAGLAAARTLIEQGADVTVFEKDTLPGGRCTTFAKDGFIFDMGPTSIAPRGMTIERALLESKPNGLQEVVKPVYTHQAGRIVQGDPIKNNIVRYCFTKGIAELGKYLAAELDIQYDSEITQIITNSSQFTVMGSTFDGVVIAVPLPMALKLVEGMGFPPPETSFYRPCISVALGYEKFVATAYHALIGLDNSHPLVWLSIESQKVDGRAPDGCTSLVAQFGPSYSKWNAKAPAEKIIHDATIDVSRLLGEDLSKPLITNIVYWEFSQPERTVQQSTLNREKRKVVIAGDGVIGGRIEQAYESGVIAANTLLERTK